MPETFKITPGDGSEMAFVINGDHNVYTAGGDNPINLEISSFSNQSRFIEIFNKGVKSFEFEIKSINNWLAVSQWKGEITNQSRILIQIDWDKISLDQHKADLIINGPMGFSRTINVIANNFTYPDIDEGIIHLEADGYVSIEANNYNKSKDSDDINWLTIPNFGKTSSGVTVQPSTAPIQQPGSNSPHLSYMVNFETTGEITIDALLSPTIDFTNSDGLQYAISIDDQEPQMINIHEKDNLQAWESNVANNINSTLSKHVIEEAGIHTIKYWVVNPGLVLQKLVINTGGLKPSYLGPPESKYISK